MRKIGVFSILYCLSAVAFAAGDGHGSEGGGMLQQLGIDFQLLIVQFIGFIILVFLLNKFLFKPIGSLLERRKQDIQDTYDKIEADKAEMAKMKADYELRLEQIESEARDRIQSAIKEANSMKDSIIEDARNQAEQLRKENAEDLEEQRRKVLIELRMQVADMAILASEKLIGKTLDTPQNRQLVQEFIDTVEVR